jgi:ABC-type branched-subunit amino acid transport system substrate-binding protein
VARRRALVVVVAMITFAAGCGASGDSAAPVDDDISASSTPAEQAVTSGDFGNLDEVCGPDVDGTMLTVDPSEAGVKIDALNVGLANERANQFRPGLLREVYDAGLAFAAWCNEQGGIGGLEVNPVDLDGKGLEVEAAMAQACTDVFALVAGGFIQDNLMFSGKPGSDFDECGLIAFPAFAAAAELSENDRVVQPLPTSEQVISSAPYELMAQEHPEAMESVLIVWPQLESLRPVVDRVTAAVEPLGSEVLPALSYDALGVTDWNLVAQQIINSEATSANFIGEPGNFSLLNQKLKAQRWNGVVWAQTNLYDPLTLTSSGADAADGAFVTTPIESYIDPEPGSAAEQMVDIIGDYGPSNAKFASFTAQSFSAFLLFAEAAKACGAANDGVLTRQCVVDAGMEITEWTGGGLHTDTAPGLVRPARCARLMAIEDGEFVEIAAETCYDPGLAEI